MTEILIVVFVLAVCAFSWWTGRQQGRSDEQLDARQANDRIADEAEQDREVIGDMPRADVLAELRQRRRSRGSGGSSG